MIDQLCFKCQETFYGSFCIYYQYAEQEIFQWIEVFPPIHKPLIVFAFKVSDRIAIIFLPFAAQNAYALLSCWCILYSKIRLRWNVALK